MIKEIQTWLPVFPGFYCSEYEFNMENVLEDLNEKTDKNYTYNDIFVNEKEYEKTIITNFCDMLLAQLSDFITEIKPENITYNNDSTDTKISINITNIQKQFKNLDIIKQFENYLQNNNEERFYISTDINYWLNYINNLENAKNDKHEVGIILQFLFYNKSNVNINNIEEKDENDNVTYTIVMLNIDKTKYIKIN